MDSQTPSFCETISGTAQRPPLQQIGSQGFPMPRNRGASALARFELSKPSNIRLGGAWQRGQIGVKKGQKCPPMNFRVSRKAAANTSVIAPNWPEICQWRTFQPLRPGQSHPQSGIGRYNFECSSKAGSFRLPIKLGWLNRSGIACEGLVAVTKSIEGGVLVSTGW